MNYKEYFKTNYPGINPVDYINEYDHLYDLKVDAFNSDGKIIDVEACKYFCKMCRMLYVQLESYEEQIYNDMSEYNGMNGVSLFWDIDKEGIDALQSMYEICELYHTRYSILFDEEKQNAAGIDNSTCHGPEKLELGDTETRYSKLRKTKYYEQVKTFFLNKDIYDKSALDENCKDQDKQKANCYIRIFWEEIYYIATTNVKDKSGLLGFMFILYESNCFNWSKMISILLEKMYNYYDISDNAPIGFAVVVKSQMKELEGIFKDNEKPKWKDIRDHIQTMFNMMFMLEVDFGENKYNYKSNARNNASSKFSNNNVMLYFSATFDYDLNTKELERIKKSQKKTNDKRKGKRNNVSRDKMTIEFEGNKHSL